MNFQTLLIVVIIVWLTFISLAQYLIIRYFRKLSKQVNKGNLIKILEKVLDTEMINTKGIKDIKKEIIRIDGEKLKHIQHISLVRFNPFRELGGDHSFVLVLLDGTYDGFILTGLHTRERTRVYLKEVVKGGCKLELSNDEKKALAKIYRNIH